MKNGLGQELILKRLLRRIRLGLPVILLILVILVAAARRTGLQDAMLRNLVNHAWLTSAGEAASIPAMKGVTEKYWQLAADRSTGNPTVYLGLGRIMVLGQDYTGASEAFKKGASATRSPTGLQLISIWLLRQGQSYLDKDSYEVAQQFVTLLASLTMAEPRFVPDCTSLPIELGLGRAWRFGHEGDSQAEEIAYQLVKALAPSCADPYYRLGSLYSDRQRYAEASELYEQGIAVDTEEIVCGYGYLAGTYLAQERLDEAGRTAKTATLHGGGPQVNMVLGRLSQLKGDLLSAQEYYERAAEQASQCDQDDWARWKAHFYLGWMAFDRNEFDLAISYLERASQVMPGTSAQPQARKYVGDVYYRRGMFPEAILEYRRALAMAPEGWAWVAEVHRALADAHRDSGHSELAIQEYRRVLIWKPNDPDAIREMTKLGQSP
jgi:tetratricopeptide (TPR) repeat protein